MTENSEKLWTPRFITANFLRLFNSIVFVTLNATTALYAMNVLGANAREAGVAVGVFTIAGLFSRMILGAFTEQIGRRRLLRGSAAFLALASFVYLIPGGMASLIAARALQGAAFGVVGNMITTIVVSYIPKGRVGEGLGWFSLSSTLANAVGPALGLFLLYNAGATCMFAVFAAFACIAAILSNVLPVEELPKREGAEKRRLSLKSFIELPVVPRCLFVFASNMCYAGVVSFVAPYASDMGMSAGGYFIAYSIVLFVTRPLSGRMQDRVGAFAVLVPAFLCCVVGYMLLATCMNPVMLLLSAFFMAAGQGSVFAVVQADVVGSVPPERTAVTSSTFYMFADVSLGFGPAILGAVSGAVGYAWMYGINAVISVVCCAIAIGVLVKRAMKRRAD